MRLTLKKLTIENFKGIKKLVIDFKLLTYILGQNASGKTTVFDALCWLLFGKDSQDREKFEIRELDSQGNKIHNTEISVTGVFDKDGSEIIFKKIQKENWVKKRGSDNPTLQGNVNEMEINGYPMSDAEYKAKVAEIISEDKFKILTNPIHFSSLPWKDQRNMLMQFVADMDDSERAKTYGDKYTDLIPDLEFAKTTDDIQKKYMKASKEYKEKQSEIPVRIDELEKSKSDIDVAELNRKRDDLTNQIDDIDKMIESGAIDTSSIQERINDLKTDISDLEYKAKEEMRKEIASLKDRESIVRSSANDRAKEEGSILRDIEWKRSEREEVLKHTNEIKVKFEEAKASEYTPLEFDETMTICKMCGQPLPQDKISEIKADFEKRQEEAKEKFESERTAKIGFYKEQGLKGNEKNKGLGIDIEALEKKLQAIREEKDNFNAELKDLSAQIAKCEENAKVYVLSDLPEYKEKVEALNSAIAEMENARENATDTSSLKADKDKLKAELREIDDQIAVAGNNESIEQRIDELREEQKEVAQKVADNERMLNLLDQFVKEKMESVSQEINKKFEVVDFKLFSMQLNGGIKETCELLVDGVPFSTLNSGHRIVAGLDIIRSLQTLFDCKVPIFIDNAESVNDYNLPRLDGQMILLTVTDDKKLEVR